MRKLIPIVAAASLLSAGAAFAQAPSPSSPSPAPSPMSPSAPAEKMPSSPASPAEKMPSPGAATSNVDVLKLTDAEAKAWLNKKVYSSDNKNLGEVAAVQRDASGKVLELYADIGGFLGIGETRIGVKPTDFKLGKDRVMLNLTAEQAKALPKIPK